MPVRDVVSRNFTGWDGWHCPAGSVLCAACAWAYRTPDLRVRLLEVRRRPDQLTHLDSAALGFVLARPLEATQAVIVPLRGRKHLLPTAEWGRICVDDVCLPWSPSDADRLAVLVELRQLGFTAATLSEPIPHYSVLRDMPSARRGAVIDQWEVLEPWRRRPLWLKVALAATNHSQQAPRTPQATKRALRAVA